MNQVASGLPVDWIRRGTHARCFRAAGGVWGGCLSGFGDVCYDQTIFNGNTSF